jgi:hypothetical protein
MLVMNHHAGTTGWLFNLPVDNHLASIRKQLAVANCRSIPQPDAAPGLADALQSLSTGHGYLFIPPLSLLDI